MAQQIQLRNGTAAQWTSANPTLAVGELGVETDTSRFKVGTGSTAWASLAYVSGIGSLPSQTGNSGKYLTTDGTVSSWGTINALPTQTSNSGKYLITDGTTASWATVTSLTGITNSASPYLTAVGSGAGTSTTGVQNVVVGYGALNSNTTGAYSTAIGYQALAVSTGGQNTAVGRMAMVTATTASGNTALGVNAMYSATSAGSNVAVGDTAAQNLTTGSGNIAIGSGALNNGGGISNTVAIGTQAMLNANSGTFNLAIGYRALYAQDSYGGESNTAIGYQAFLNLKGGAGGIAQANTAVGSNAGANLTGQGNNSSTFIGAYAGYSATSGAGNTFIGSNSGYNVTSGSKNTVIGTYNGNQGSLDIRTASNYIVFSDGDGNPRGMFNGSGYFAASPSGGFPDGTNLGFHYFSSPVSAGGSGDKVVYIRADSASFAGTAFSVRGNRNTTNSTFNTFDTRNGNDTGVFIIRDSGNAINTNNSYGSTSDVVLKENIVDATPKLAALNQVKIRSYNLKAKPDEKHIGVIAQELETVFPGLVETDNEGIKNVKYSVFVPMLIKAVQELSAEVASLKSQLNRV